MKLSNYWKLYKQSFTVVLSGWMTYRLNFFLFLIATAIFNLFGPIVIYLIYSNNLAFPGWTFYQMLLLIGTLILVGGIEHYFTSSIGWYTSDLIRRGRFDHILIRPISPLKLVILRMPDLDGFAELAVGIVVVLYSIINLNTVATPVNILMYLVAVLIGFIVLTAFDIIAASLNFVFVKAYAIFDFFQHMRMFARYPISIFGALGAVIFTFFIPVALASFYPAQAFLGRISWLTIAQLLVVSLIFLGLSLYSWKLAMRRYTSAGG